MNAGACGAGLAGGAAVMICWGGAAAVGASAGRSLPVLPVWRLFPD